jgi:hypothetical protein
MRALLFVGAIVVELLMAVLLLAGIVYGITETYTIGAAGYSRLGNFGAVLAILFLWFPAWLSALSVLAVMLGLPRQWRDSEITRLKKVGITLAAIIVLNVMGCVLGPMLNGIVGWVGVGECKATLSDVLSWSWPCR